MYRVTKKPTASSFYYHFIAIILNNLIVSTWVKNWRILLEEFYFPWAFAFTLRGS